MSLPAVSVLMPVFNAERYLDETVQSILKQSFTDFEFIIIDDGSTDGSLNLLRKYESSDPRIRLVSRPNTGYCKALNEALALARGEFVARMDADDISDPRRFATQLKFLQENPDVVVVGTAVDLIDGEGRMLLRTPQPISDEEIQKAALSGHCLIVHSTVMARRQPMVEAGGYDETAAPSEDLEIWLRLGERGKLANLPDVLGKYRLHTNSVCATNSEVQKIKSREISERACKRRGVKGNYSWVDESRAGSDSKSQHAFMLKYGWWAFQSGQRSTAMLYAWRAIKQMPLGAEGWRLLLCSAVKPMTAVP